VPIKAPLLTNTEDEKLINDLVTRFGQTRFDAPDEAWEEALPRKQGGLSELKEENTKLFTGEDGKALVQEVERNFNRGFDYLRGYRQNMAEFERHRL
jgi:hypothetical protein